MLTMTEEDKCLSKYRGLYEVVYRIKFRSYFI